MQMRLTILCKRRHGPVCLLAYVLAMLPAGDASAEVQTNIIPSGAAHLVPEADGNVNISGGTQKGGNLFHSFEQFNIGEGDTAYFQNPAGGSVKNIISLVTGGKSEINGKIDTKSEFGNANLFLINPQGIVFGAKARLGIGGSFFASTADTLRFEDGSTLDTGSANKANLSSAPLVAFGFLDASAAPIEINGAKLIGKGAELTIAGGDIIIDDEATIKANRGQINLLSRMDYAGEIKLNVAAQDPNGSTDLGMVTIRNGAKITGAGAGSSVLILARALLVEGDKSKILVRNGGDNEGIGIDVTRDLKVLEDGSIITATSGGETASNINVTVRQGGVTVSGESSQINSSSSGGGVAGNISITTNNSTIRIKDGGRIQATSSGFGKQSAGDITLVADKLMIEQGGQILNRASGDGTGGTVTISADIINITDDITYPKPGIQSETTGSGDAGEIIIRPAEKNLVIKGSGAISADSGIGATGNAGNISIDATEGDILITDSMNISAKTSAAGQGGSITVIGKNVDITNGASLTAESRSEELSLPDSTDNQEYGKSGNISVTATDSFVIDSGKISLSTQQADAGNIIIRGGKLFRMDNQAEITTSVAGGQGNGGDISINENIDSNLVILSNSSEIRANARKGAGGNIDIKAYSHLISTDSIIDASAGPAGIDGDVTVTTPDVDATTGILQLPESFLDASTLLSSRCSMRTASNSSSFVVGSNNNMTTPDALLSGSISSLDRSSENVVESHLNRSAKNGVITLLSKRMVVRCR